ncbi:MAG: hypothetical protein KatS3mg100_047 [Candidatus Parcubacteria bacterium]|nr:MAG: hypothetical protein KatS3mg100_047 [Candidatus Parcubacteria bacterium]
MPYSPESAQPGSLENDPQRKSLLYSFLVQQLQAGLSLEDIRTAYEIALARETEATDIADSTRPEILTAARSYVELIKEHNLPVNALLRHLERWNGLVGLCRDFPLTLEDDSAHTPVSIRKTRETLVNITSHARDGTLTFYLKQGEQDLYYKTITLRWENIETLSKLGALLLEAEILLGEHRGSTIEVAFEPSD